MRAGVVASAVLHTGLITLAVVGLNAAQPLEPQQIESIEIDLVPIEEFSNIRTGTLESKTIETETPSAVETPDPAILAERTGNTEDDQPKPEQTDTATPAPTIQTAPEPEAVKASEPEPEPVAPEPTPEPISEPEPVLAAPTEPETPAEIAPQPVIKTASIDQKRAEFKLKKDEEAKRRAADREAEKQAKAQEATKIDDLINAEKSRGATTGSGGQATVGKPTGQAARLTQSEQAALAAQMRKCWNPPLAALSEPGLTSRLLVELNRDGTVARAVSVIDRDASALEQTMGRAAQRAVRRCAPYKLSAEKYDDWRQVDVTFDPRDL